MGKLKKKECLLLLVMLGMLLTACTQRAEPVSDAVTVWYTAECPFAGELEKLAAEYNAALKNGALPVSLRAVESEEALAQAFNLMPPDLLLCAHSQAFRLYERGLLRTAAISDVPDYGELERYSPCVGSGYFPLGYQVQLLYARADAFDSASPDRLEELLDRAAGYGEQEKEPFFTASSFAELLYDMTLSLGSEFHALRSRDISNRDYVYAYNLLAEAAYTGGLSAVEYPAAGLVQGGYLPCAAVCSTELVGCAEDGYVIAPLPRIGEGEDYLAESFGLALTVREGRDAAPAEAFLRWLLQPERLCAAALDAGLVPPVDTTIQAESALDTALIEVGRQGSPHLPAPGCDFLKNRTEFETEFRKTMERLN